MFSIHLNVVYRLFVKNGVSQGYLYSEYSFISLQFQWICISTNVERIHNNDNIFHNLYDILNEATSFRKKLGIR